VLCDAYHDREAPVHLGGVPAQRVREAIAFLAEIDGERDLPVDAGPVCHPPNFLLEVRCSCQCGSSSLDDPVPQLSLRHRMV
jgi:hypothetical protein